MCSSDLNLKRGVDSYEKLLKKAHKHGIGVLAFLIFGMESDKKEDLYARRDFILNSSIDAYQSTILTPLPGTVLYDRLKAQDRIVLNNYPADWQQYDCQKSMIDHPNMDHREIESIMYDIWPSLYNKESMRRKMFRTLWNTKSFKTAYWTYSANYNYGRIFLEPVFEANPNGINKNFEWKNRKRSFYLKFTDKVVWLFYQLAWNRMLKRFVGR